MVNVDATPAPGWPVPDAPCPDRPRERSRAATMCSADPDLVSEWAMIDSHHDLDSSSPLGQSILSPDNGRMTADGRRAMPDHPSTEK